MKENLVEEVNDDEMGFVVESAMILSPSAGILGSLFLIAKRFII